MGSDSYEELEEKLSEKVNYESNEEYWKCGELLEIFDIGLNKETFKILSKSEMIYRG